MSYDPMFPTTKEILRKLGGDVTYKRITLGAQEMIESPFSELVGLEVVDNIPGRMLLSVPSAPPSTEGLLLHSGSFEISYGTYNQMLSKPCLLIGDYASLSVRCPSFFYDPNKYQALLYAFEEVTDTMGLGLTFAKGWHAVNTSTFANEPFDPEAYPSVTRLDEIEKGDEYVKEMYSLRERISFTVKSENIVYNGGSAAVVIAATPLTDNMLVYVSFTLAAGKLYRLNNGTATITYTETLVPINPKYLGFHTALDLSDFINAYEAGDETTENSLDVARLKTFIEGFENKNLLIEAQRTNGTLLSCVAVSYEKTSGDGINTYKVRIAHPSSDEEKLVFMLLIANGNNVFSVASNQ